MKSILCMALFAMMVITSGCDKDDSPSAMTSTQILASHTWQVDEVFQALTGTLQHYVRGGENTTGVAQGTVRMKFNLDGTGTYTDITGSTFNMTWNFGAGEKTIDFVVNGNVNYHWALMSITSTQLVQTSPYNNTGLVSARWTIAP